MLVRCNLLTECTGELRWVGALHSTTESSCSYSGQERTHGRSKRAVTVSHRECACTSTTSSDEGREGSRRVPYPATCPLHVQRVEMEFLRLPYACNSARTVNSPAALQSDARTCYFTPLRHNRTISHPHPHSTKRPRQHHPEQPFDNGRGRSTTANGGEAL